MQSYALTVDKFLDQPPSGLATARSSRRSGPSRGAASAMRRCGTAATGCPAPCVSLGLRPRRPGRHPGLEHPAPSRDLLCRDGRGAGLPHAQSAPDRAHLAAMVNEAEDRVLAVAADLLPLLAGAGAALPGARARHRDGRRAGRARPARRSAGPRSGPTRPCSTRTARATPWGDFDEEAPAGLCYTSGTTGPPKGVLYTHRSNYLHTLRALQADAIALTASDVVLLAVPMFHANGWGLPFAAPAVGAKLVLPGRHTDGASLARLMRDEGVTVAVGRADRVARRGRSPRRDRRRRCRTSSACSSAARAVPTR